MSPTPPQPPLTTRATPEPKSTHAPENADTTMHDATAQDTAPPPAPSPPCSSTKKRKRKDKSLAEKQPHILHQATFRKTAWSYFHLVLVTPGTASSSISTSTSTTTPPSTTTTDPASLSLSPLLTSTLLTAPLRAYLGTTGTAIPIDMLQISGRSIWLRVPRQDARGLRASLSGWVGSCEGDEIPGVGAGMGRVGVAWRVVGECGVLGGVCDAGRGDGAELFG